MKAVLVVVLAAAAVALLAAHAQVSRSRRARLVYPSPRAMSQLLLLNNNPFPSISCIFQRVRIGMPT